MITPEQCRAARAWLRWSQRKLGAEADVSPVTIRLFEQGQRRPMKGTLLLIRTALEREGFEFPADGLRKV